MVRHILLLGLGALLGLSCAAFADGSPRLNDLRVAVEGGQVLLSFDLVGAFDERLAERVESGLPTTLVYEIELLRDRKHWFDKFLAGSTLTVIGIYDAVRREYLVNFKLDGRLVESRLVRDLEALERAMTHFERLPVMALPPQPDNRRLLVRARAELGSKTVMLFIPSSIDTDWLESPKFRPPADLVK